MIQRLGSKMLEKTELRDLCTSDLSFLFKRIKRVVGVEKSKNKSLDKYKPFISYKALIKEELNLRTSEDIVRSGSVIEKEYKTLEDLGLIFEVE